MVSPKRERRTPLNAERNKIMKKTFKIYVSVNDEEYTTEIKVKAEKVEILPSYWDEEILFFKYPISIDGLVLEFDERIVDIIEE